MHCERCGKEINVEDAYKVTMTRHGRTESRDLCEECKLLSESFMTAAFVPGISKTQYELLLHTIRAKDSNPDNVKDRVMRLREQGMTIPEISKEIGICNKCVMRLVK